jgi:hypothetical protein
LVPGAIDDVKAVVTELRRAGATNTGLVRASYGGAIVIGASPSVPIQATVALSPALFDVDLGGGATAEKGIANLTAPLLLAVAPDDSSSAIAEIRALLPKAPKGVVTFVEMPPGTGHGWDLVRDDAAPDGWSAFSDDLIAFLTVNLR